MKFFTKLQDQLSISFSRLIAATISGFFWFYLASILEKTEYGELGYLISVAGIASEVSILGLNQLIIVYGAKKEDVSSAYFFGLISSSSVSIITYLIIQNIAISLLIIGYSIFILTTSGLNSKKKYGSYSIYIILQRALIVILSLFFYSIFGMNGLVLGFALANVLVIKEFFNYVKGKKIDLSFLKTKISFLINNYATRLNWIIFWAGDKIMIGLIFGFYVLGNYQFASMYMIFLSTIPSSLAVYLLPLESEGTPNKKLKVYYIILSCVIVVAAVLLLPYLIEIFLPNYQEAVLTMQVMTFALIPFTFTIIRESEFLGRENSRIVLIGSVLQTTSYFIMILVLGNEFGLLGFGFAFLFSTIPRTIFYLLFQHKNSKFNNSIK